MNRSTCRRHIAGVLMLGSVAIATQRMPIDRPDDALFAATVTSLADSLQSIRKMVGAPLAHEVLRVDPRPLLSTVARGSPVDQALVDMQGFGLDSLSASDRAARVTLIRKRGFTTGDLVVLGNCPAAEVAPPGDSQWKPPKFCTFIAAGVGIGVESRTPREAIVKVLIIAAMPTRIEYTARFTFVRGAGWRLTHTTPWAIAE